MVMIQFQIKRAWNTSLAMDDIQHSLRTSVAILMVMMIQLLGCIRSPDWTTGLSYFPFLDKFVCLFVERSLHFYN